jgi:hypothetical protein
LYGGGAVHVGMVVREVWQTIGRFGSMESALRAIAATKVVGLMNRPSAAVAPAAA